MSSYQPIIGLEVHIELSTKSKMFCWCSADYFGTDPNTHTCPICLGLPGAMPKANELAIKFAQKLGLALNCKVQLSSKFDRKNYFYPDLAKGFQISQYDLPFSGKGHLEIDTSTGRRAIEITRAHLEEDTGKLTHAVVEGEKVTLIDFNRSGVPLMEVVSEPQMNSAEEAKTYAQKLQQIVRYLEISDADMEKGSMRIEPNVSLRKAGGKSLPGYKVELKNINSFKFAKAAIEYEIKRQAEILNRQEVPTQETRGWNEQKSQTISQRTKELAHDYRYFPEPDLLPFVFDKNYFDEIKRGIPELPDKKTERFIREYQLSAYDVEILTRDKNTANYFEEALRVGKKFEIPTKHIANVIINKKPDIEKVLPAELIEGIVSARKAASIGQDELERIMREVLDKNPKAIEDYKKGKENAIMFLTGQIVKAASGKVDAKKVTFLLKERLK